MNILPIKSFNIKNNISFAAKPKKYSKNNQTDVFIKSENGIDIARLKDLGIKNFRLIDSNSVRGVSLANHKNSIFSELKECGIETIIDLRTEGSDTSKYAQNCKKAGLNYFNLKIKKNMPIFNNLTNCNMPTETRNASIEEFVEKLPKLFDIMNKGKYYMACLLGLHRTDLTVTLNYLLNPKEPKTPPVLTHMYKKEETNFTNQNIGLIKNLIRNLSEKQKNQLNLPPNFQEIFGERIMKLKIMNGLSKL